MITIIIPVFNNIDYTKECIKSIYKNTDLNSFKLLIIDNASTDGTENYLLELKSIYNNFEFIKNDKNLGFAKACNLAVENSNTEKILFLNNDTVVTPNWLKILNNELENNPKVKIVGSKLLYKDNTIQHAGIVFSNFKNSSGQNLHYHIYRFFPSNHPFVNKKRYFQALTGACILTYKDFFVKVGKFNENYLNGSEDVDFCLKAGEYGAKILYCPKSVVYHHEAKTNGRFDKVNENLDLFYSVWNNKIIPDDFKYFKEDGLNLIKVIENYITVTSLDFFYEKICKNPKLAIFIKDYKSTDIKELILSINANTKDDFKLFLISDTSNYLKDKFTNLEIIESKKFNIKLLSNLVKDNFENISFAFKSFDTKNFLNSYQKLENINDENFEYWEKFYNLFEYDKNFMLLFAKYYWEKNNFEKVLNISSKVLSIDSKNTEIRLLLSDTLEKLGDFETAKKIKNNL